MLTMKILTLCTTLAAFLAWGFVPAQAAPNPKLSNPVRPEREGARDLQGQVRHLEGRFRHRGHAGLGPQRRRPLLQPGEERLLRRVQVLPRHLRLHGPVRDQRRSGPEQRLERGEDPRRSGPGEQQAGLRDLRHRGPQHPDDADLHQLQRPQHGAGRAGLLPVRKGRRGDGGRGQAQQRVWRRRSPGARAPIRAGSSPKETLTSRKSFPNLDYIKTATILTGEAGKAPEKQPPASESRRRGESAAPQPSRGRDFASRPLEIECRRNRSAPRC